MATKKNYLDEDGVRVLVNYVNDGLDLKMDKTEIANYATKTEVQNIANNYTSKEEVENEIDAVEASLTEQIGDLRQEVEGSIDELDDEITALKQQASVAYHFKGSVANEAALANIQNPEVGDVYNAEDTGMNFGWTGTEWDNLGAFVDLEPYALDENIQPIPEETIRGILYGGKFSVVNDVDGVKDMLTNDQAEVEIALAEDLDAETVISIPAGKTVTLNLNGKELSGEGAQTLVVQGDLTLKGGKVSGARSVVVANGGSLTVDGTDIDSTDCAISVDGAGSSVVVKGGTIKAQEVPVLTTGGGSAVINGGHLIGLDNFAIGGNGNAGQSANVTINGGIIEGRIQSAGYIAAAIYWPNAGSLTINGGEIISAGAGIVQRAGNVVINEGAKITANGATGVMGKVGDSKVTVGPYAVVYDKSANYPESGNMSLNIASGASLVGTDGDLQILGDGSAITDNR
jgi:hypothetical protein